MAEVVRSIVDDPPTRKANVHTAAVRRASEILGGPSKLRKYLGVSAIALGVWIAGSEPPPTDIFLKAVDVIVESDLEELNRKK
jgi:hypothetical protein